MTYADRRPKEIKNREYRVGVTPESVDEVVHHGRKVLVETKAGSGIGGVIRRSNTSAPLSSSANWD